MNKKKVGFDKVIFYLVPKISEEYKKDMWWSREENNESFKEAIKEIKELMSHNSSMEKKHAMKLLYQPGNISYNKENFE